MADHSADAPRSSRPGVGPAASGGTASFGFRTVREDEKAVLVGQVFDRVARRYDLMNDLMSAGIHRLWKRAMVEWLAPRRGRRYLDVAGGTGDIARRIRDRTGSDGPPVIVCDINASMLSVGRDRSIDAGRPEGLAWVCADAESLPFPDCSLDAYTVAFGLRNVTRLDAALAEARRVLRPGGRFLCLEFSHVAVPALAAVYDRYSFSVLPALGRLVVGDADSYRYLAESIRRFPDQQAFAARIRAAGLDLVKVRNLSGGIAALHSAWAI